MGRSCDSSRSCYGVRPGVRHSGRRGTTLGRLVDGAYARDVSSALGCVGTGPSAKWEDTDWGRFGSWTAPVGRRTFGTGGGTCSPLLSAGKICSCVLSPILPRICAEPWTALVWNMLLRACFWPSPHPVGGVLAGPQGNAKFANEQLRCQPGTMWVADIPRSRIHEGFFLACLLA